MLRALSEMPRGSNGSSTGGNKPDHLYLPRGHPASLRSNLVLLCRMSLLHFKSQSGWDGFHLLTHQCSDFPPLWPSSLIDMAGHGNQASQAGIELGLLFHVPGQRTGAPLGLAARTIPALPKDNTSLRQSQCWATRSQEQQKRGPD